MHEPMYDHPGVVDALARLESWGVDFVDPRIEEGKAKIAENDAVAAGVARATTDHTLAGRHVVVTAGATAEPVDPLRVLTNRASGRTGRAVARACHVRGADVTLVHGTGSPVPEVPFLDRVTVESAAEMLDATLSAVAGDSGLGVGTPADALVSAAAISDYTVEERPEKLRSGEPRTLELHPTQKVIDRVRDAHPDLPVVGFKAETSGDDDAMTAAARETMDRVGLAFVVANDASVMGAAESRALVVDRGSVSTYTGHKRGLGAAVADRLASVVDG
jgi:phosphopantothenoylcysteine decarboxylase/phosphopantothenate--cysteine ligase